MTVFIEFFYLLRDQQIPVSLTEFITFCDALTKNLVHNSSELYYLMRSLLVKDEKYFDAYDQAFLFYFKDAPVPEKIRDDILEWLKKPAPSALDRLSPQERQILEELIKKRDLADLQQRFEEKLHEQTEEHNGGSQWIGTGGTSAFGWGGKNAFGIRVGGEGGYGLAVKIAQKRLFRNYRSDLILDTRQIQVALRKLRKLSKIGAPETLNLDASIQSTCKNGGEIDLVFEQQKKNNVKLLLLMDVGGSMDPFAQMVEQLFSAANKCAHFRDFKYFYFHNCIYDKIYEDMELEKTISTATLFSKYDSEYRIILVGDAAMAPYELTNRFGAIDYFQLYDTPGLEWLQRLRKHFPKSAWLNPEVVGAWLPESRKLIMRIFPMFQLSLDGLDQAIKTLT